MEKKVIKLTESDLHEIINESVRRIIAENMTDEGWFDTMKSFANQYGQRGAAKAQEIGQKVGNAAKNAYNNVKQDVQNTWNNAKQDSSMVDMQKAFNNFKAAVEKYKAAGGKVNGQLASRVAGIDNMLNGYQRHY